MITSNEKADETILTRTYPVEDLLTARTYPAGEGKQGSKYDDTYEPLVKAIMRTIKPDSWAESGGSGDIAAVGASKSLVISQTYDVHEKVLELLRSLRAARAAVPRIDVKITGPRQMTVGQDAEFKIRVTNAGAAPAKDITVVAIHSPEVVFQSATDGFMKYENGDVAWIVNTWPVGKAVNYTLKCRAMEAAPDATQRVTVTPGNAQSTSVDTQVRIVSPRTDEPEAAPPDPFAP